MAKLYGSIGWCEKCLKQRRKLHGYVRGVVFCMRCYSLWRMKDPHKRDKQLESARRYRIRNKKKIDAYNAEYLKKRYHADPEFRKKIIANVKKYRDAKVRNDSGKRPSRSQSTSKSSSTK